MKQVEIIARSEEQALQKASLQLETPVEDLVIVEEYDPDQIDLDELAKEEAELPEEERSAGEPVLYVVQISQGTVIEPIQEWIQGLVERFQPGATCEVIAERGELLAVIDGPDPSIFIGRQGHTLAALQHIVTRVVPHLVDEDCPPVNLDVGDYRDRRLKILERIADGAARRAQKTRRSVALKPMPSTDRKFVHNFLKTVSGISTVSQGREPRRYVIIEPAGGQGRGGGGRGSGRGGNRGRSNGGNHQEKRGGNVLTAEERYIEEQRRKMREAAENPPAPLEAGYEDVTIEETPTRLPEYKADSVDESLLDPNRPLVDEIE